jgi:hypothetical protein
VGDLRGPGVSPFENRNMVQIVFTAAGSELLSREVTVHSNEELTPLRVVSTRRC